jgi:DHA1 family inner membrane transport protein
MGLLPNIAQDLLPTVFAASHEQANSQAGFMVTAYALGVVIGAPTVAAVSARFPRRTLLAWLLVAFTLATVASALLPTFGLVLVARFVAGLPHGAYFGVAALVAASLMGPGRRARGVALVLGGLTVANIVGVPAITRLGQVAGWRIAYLSVAALFALTLVAVLLAVPWQAGDPHATIKRELKAFGRIQVWFALLIGSVGFGGFFAVYTYIAPLVTEVTKLPASFVPIVLVVAGVGMTIGNFIGGHTADRNIMGSLFLFFGTFALSLLGIALTASTPVGLLIFVFLVSGSASALSPAIQTRLMDVAGDSQTLAAAVNHASLNLGNSLGAFLGGAAIAAGLGYVAPAWVGLVLCVPGVALALGSVGLDRRRRLTGTATI